jgi:dTDP-4-amino-4,6-dideoxygalactose transaminase
MTNALEPSAEGEVGNVAPALMVPILPSADDLLPFIREIDQRRIYSNDGPLAQALRLELASFLSARMPVSEKLHVAIVANGTIAIELALRLRARAGKFVIMPSYTFVATAHAVANAGFQPWFADVDADTWALSPHIVEMTIADLPTPPAAVVAVSPFGAPVDQRAWNDFEARTGIPVVLDMAAGALSLEFVGNVPACLSLHATKLLGIGEGGAMVSRDLDFIAAARSASSFGFEPGTRTAVRRGGNYRLSEYAAAIGHAALDQISMRERQLKSVASTYRHLLRDQSIGWQPGFGSDWIAMTLNLRFPKDKVASTISLLEKYNIPWRRWWSLGCHVQPPFAQSKRSKLRHTETLAYCIIGLPFHELLTDQQMKMVADVVSEALQ